MKAKFYGALVLTCAITAGAVYALPDCNYAEPNTTKYCVDPYNKCERYVSSAPGVTPQVYDCPGSFDDSRPVTPSCKGGGCASFCASDGNTQCSQVRVCTKSVSVTGVVSCSDGGANNAPTYTTYYYGSKCNDDCDEL